MDEEYPRVFISYSHDNIEHVKRVERLAEDLVNDGVDVKADFWELRDGHDVYNFMEKIGNPDFIDKVLMIFDKSYVEKANNKKAGTGVETQIISKDIYKQIEDKNVRFVGIVIETDENGDACCPYFYKSKMYIDYCDEDSAESYDQILRFIYNKPLKKKPKFGKRPELDSESNQISLGTRIYFKRVVGSIRSGNDNWNGLFKEYLETYSQT